jgi:hypothetical protein
MLIYGGGPMAATVATNAIRVAVSQGRQPKIFVYREPGRDGHRLEPWCYQVASIHEVDSISEMSEQPTVGFVCGDSGDASAVGHAVGLARRFSATQIFVAVYRESARQTLDFAREDDRIHIVSAKLYALAEELLEQSDIEVLARARHEDYVRRERERGATIADNPSLVDWLDLPESLKESNRRFAESVGGSLAELGAELRPLDPSHALPRVPFSSDQLERLACREHERWIRDLERDGWRSTDGAKDPARKLHPLLVAWEDLPEGEKEKDRDVFRGLPRMLAEVGFEMILPGQDDAQR